MSEVYKYSYCNLAAVASRDDNGGCFYPRDISMDLPIRVDVISRDTQSSPSRAQNVRPQSGSIDEFGRHVSTPCDILVGDPWLKDIIQSPLNNRAWVVQEVPTSTW